MFERERENALRRFLTIPVCLSHYVEPNFGGGDEGMLQYAAMQFF